MSGKTSNHGLIQLELNDNANFPQLLNDTFTTIDNGIAPFYVAILNSSNVYKITTGLSLTALQDGFSVRIAIPSASTGATSLIVDSISAIAIKKVNGSAVTNLKANGVYSLTYYNGNFILASGADDSDSTSVGTDGSNVKTGITFIGTDGEVHAGIYTADGTITAGDVLSGKIGHSKGNKILGTMPNNGPLNASIGVNGTFNIPSGYTSGGKVTQSIPTLDATTYTPKTTDQTIAAGKYLSGAQTIKGDSNLIAANIISGKSIFGVSGNATIQSLGGKQYKSGSGNASGGGTTWNPISVNCGFQPSIVAITFSNRFFFCASAFKSNFWYEGLNDNGMSYGGITSTGFDFQVYGTTLYTYYAWS